MLSLPREILPAICPDPGVAAVLSRVCRGLAHLRDAFEITLGPYGVIAQSYFHTIGVILPFSAHEGVYNYIITYRHNDETVYRGANNLHWLPALCSAGVKIYARARAKYWIPLPPCSDVILGCKVNSSFYPLDRMHLWPNALPAAKICKFDELYARIDPHTPPEWTCGD